MILSSKRSTKLFKSNLLLWATVSITLAVMGDAINNAVCTAIIGTGQLVTPALNLTSGTVAVYKLFKLRKMLTLPLAVSVLPALVTCFN